MTSNFQRRLHLARQGVDGENQVQFDVATNLDPRRPVAVNLERRIRGNKFPLDQWLLEPDSVFEPRDPARLGAEDRFAIDGTSGDHPVVTTRRRPDRLA